MFNNKNRIKTKDSGLFQNLLACSTRYEAFKQIVRLHWSVGNLINIGFPWFLDIYKLSIKLGVTLPETNSSPLKMMVSNRNLLFQGAPIFRGYVSFREGTWSCIPTCRPGHIPNWKHTRGIAACWRNRGWVATDGELNTSTQILTHRILHFACSASSLLVLELELLRVLPFYIHIICYILHVSITSSLSNAQRHHPQSCTRIAMWKILLSSWRRGFHVVTMVSLAQSKLGGGFKHFCIFTTTWVFPKIGVPQNGWFIVENPIKMG